MKNKLDIPAPAIERLSRLYSLITVLQQEGKESISSSQISEYLQAGAHNIRKDISYLGETGTSGSGYKLITLKNHINQKFQFNTHRKACIVGMGALGGAILNYKKILMTNIEFVAGFDSDINKIETMKSPIPLYPSYDIIDIIRKYSIELAVITVPEDSAEDICIRLIEAGIKGIINFSPVVLRNNTSQAIIKNIDLMDEFRHLTALIALQENQSLCNCEHN